MARNKSFVETGGKPEALSFDNAAINKKEEVNEIAEGTVMNETEDVFDLLEQKKREDNTVLKGFKIDKDIAKLVDKLGKKIGRGGNSKLVNQLLREGLQRRGYID